LGFCSHGVQALLNASGFIYSANHEGWYSVSDEVFFPDSKVEVAVDPMTGKKRPVGAFVLQYANAKSWQISKESGNPVEWTSEVNYRFRLSEFQEPLLEWYSKNPNCIEPKSRRDYIIDSVKAGVHDISVSRPIDRVQWGIPVPDDPSQSIYVWLDALMNYAAQTGYPHYNRMELGGWPADIHVVGKDIIRFVTVLLHSKR
jgi:methionyl-tRNA synthetase